MIFEKSREARLFAVDVRVNTERKDIKYAGRRYLAHAQSRKVPSMQHAAREKGNAPTPIRHGHVSLLWLLCSFCSHDRATASRDAGGEHFSGNPGCSCLTTILRLFCLD